ncbi:Response regulator/GGDEF domain protein [Stigmatella aurantiaca DW4/3-1]|uniref:diguanylate cyclase n=1 Tax=Stigmatella aurantiaca (strain DW4/3-1) TaxID=378806 RepID=E3FK35_STIAD|nr:diguanylate cyclase [Stigmatella aurantiaca]ADO74218.1 Response regulator/GGDEF domain protein [Stigmatella aurantiaca DW4/3-1]
MGTTPDSSNKRMPEGGRRAGSEGAGRTVLIVDDDPTHVQHVREGLAPQGYRFREARDGAQALSAIREHRPDLILMDVEMPGLGGVEVCRIVKANAGEGGFGFIPVILMTARQAAGKVEGLELGADDYLVKPFDMLELSARVKSMLRLKALQDALIEKNRELDRANKELARKREELLTLSRTDPLTSLSNRRYFEERLAEEFARARRYRSPLSLVMLDIDHFKRINDTYGHPFGDEVLRAVALVSRTRLREVDLLARYGGEELIALLPETSPADALRACERVREAIESLRLDYRASDGTSQKVSCTASLGLASLPSVPLQTAEDLLRAADECLYKAKEAGRNRVRQYEE